MTSITYAQLREDTAGIVMVYLTLSGTETPATGLTPTIEISKNGAAFAAPVGSVAEVSDGWYACSLNLADTSTPGQLIVKLTDATADPGFASITVCTHNPLSIWAGQVLAESYAGVGAEGTPAQLLYMIWAALNNVNISGTAMQALELDDTTPAMGWLLNDATTPTGKDRTS